MLENLNPHLTKLTNEELNPLKFYFFNQYLRCYIWIFYHQVSAKAFLVMVIQDLMHVSQYLSRLALFATICSVVKLHLLNSHLKQKCLQLFGSERRCLASCISSEMQASEIRHFAFFIANCPILKYLSFSLILCLISQMENS